MYHKMDNLSLKTAFSTGLVQYLYTFPYACEIVTLNLIFIWTFGDFIFQKGSFQKIFWL
jgi:hypothetical protein